VKRAVLTLIAALAVALPATAAASDTAQVRRVDLAGFPLVRVTAVAPTGSRPILLENGRRAEFTQARDLGSANALVLAVDNSDSMSGEPLREAKKAAATFLAGRRSQSATGLVAFGHEALALTRLRDSESDVAGVLRSLSTDAQVGTSLYDAVELSVARLGRMSNGSRILVLLTDGRDRGSRSTLAGATAAAQRAHVIVYAIAAGPGADRAPLAALASATGGRLFSASDATAIGAAYDTLGRELDRTWEISYMSNARPRDTVDLALEGAGSARTLRIPADDNGGLLPASVVESPYAVFGLVALVALFLAAAGVALLRRRPEAEIARILEPHVQPPGRTDDEARSPFESLLAWTESSMNDLPGSTRLSRELERSGMKLRLGHLPWLALVAAFVFGIVTMIVGAPVPLALLAMLVGLAAPFAALRIAARKRTKAFDEQLPDVLATIASTLRAGHGLRTALRAIVDDGAAPASQEFGRVLGEERLGRPLDQAIDAMCQRLGSPDLEYVATAINVQARAGGSLASLFDTLSETVRERQRHARKVHALTALGRMSAIALVAMPIALAGLMTVISPSYMTPLYTSSGGHILIAVCLTSMAIGSLFLKRIVSVRF
jgi:Flp pilus assembly protein TadB